MIFNVNFYLRFIYYANYKYMIQKSFEKKWINEKEILRKDEFFIVAKISNWFFVSKYL
jgi:hypothetical protein